MRQLLGSQGQVRQQGNVNSRAQINRKQLATSCVHFIAGGEGKSYYCTCRPCDGLLIGCRHRSYAVIVATDVLSPAYVHLYLAGLIKMFVVVPHS